MNTIRVHKWINEFDTEPGTLTITAGNLVYIANFQTQKFYYRLSDIASIKPSPVFDRGKKVSGLRLEFRDGGAEIFVPIDMSLNSFKQAIQEIIKDSRQPTKTLKRLEIDSHRENDTSAGEAIQAESPEFSEDWTKKTVRRLSPLEGLSNTTPISETEQANSAQAIAEDERPKHSPEPEQMADATGRYNSSVVVENLPVPKVRPTREAELHPPTLRAEPKQTDNTHSKVVNILFQIILVGLMLLASITFVALLYIWAVP